MTPQFISAAVVVASIVMYQICMKSIPEGVNPISALVTFYLSALVCTMLAARFFADSGAVFSMSEFSWAAVLVGVAIVGIELGYLLMYRSGWTLAAAPLIGMGGAAIILTVIGMAVFRQPITIKTVAGVGLCLYGLYLLTPTDKVT